MKCDIKKNKHGYTITISPENTSETNYLEQWDWYIERFIDRKGNLVLMI